MESIYDMGAEGRRSQKSEVGRFRRLDRNRYEIGGDIEKSERWLPARAGWVRIGFGLGSF